MEKRRLRVKKSKAVQERDDEKSHPITEKDGKSKIVVLEEYYNFDSMRQMPITNATMERLVGEGRKWAKTDPDAFKINQWLEINGIPRMTWDRWREKYDIIRNGNNEMIMILGNKREVGLIRREYDSQSTSFMMTHYDKDWKDTFAWKASLKEKKENTSGSITEKYIIKPAITSEIKHKDENE